MKKSRRLISSVFAIIVCFALLIGTTFAWFSDSSATGINKIQSGNLGVALTYTNSYTGTPESVNEDTKIFMDIDGNPILWEPGASTSGRFEVANDGTLALKYQLALIYANATETPTGKTLADALSIYAITRNKTTGDDGVMEDATLEALPIDGAVPEYDPMNMPSFKDGITLEGYLLPGESLTYEIGICWIPTENDNEFNVEGGLSIDFAVALVATQANFESDGDGFTYDSGATLPSLPTIPEAPVADTWDGTLDFSWVNLNSDEGVLASAAQFAAFAKMVDGSVTAEDLALARTALTADDLNNYFSSAKNITLAANIDLYREDENGEPISFDPIGSYRYELAFQGVFDGGYNTIYNLNQNTWELDNGYHYTDCGLGLFGALQNATVKNLTIDGADISGESAICGTIAAYAENTVFENVTIKNANVADYQYYAGGIVGWASGNTQFIGCVVDETTTVASQWGDFDNAVGGVIGGAGGSANILMKDCTVACRIDAYNDATARDMWFAYRRAGMLIGNTNKVVDRVATAPQLTCENVTVIYGDWANYTYCEFSAESFPYVRVQEGISNSAYSNPRYGHPTDAAGNEVVDDNHVHNDGEDHHILLAFDQLYGGGTGTYGQAAHEGVNVIYNNR